MQNNQEILSSLIKNSKFLHPLEKEEYLLTIAGEIPVSELFKKEFKEFLSLEYSYWSEYQAELENLQKDLTEELIAEEKRTYPEKKKLIEEYYFYLQKYVDDFSQEMEEIEKKYENDEKEEAHKEDMSEIEKIRARLKM